MNRAPLVLLAALSLSTWTACKRGDSNKRGERAAANLPPLAVPSSAASLAVNGFGDAVVVLPGGASKPMPVLVAVLGIGDTPEEQCATWRDIVGARAFILCPRGAKNMVQEEPEAGEPGGAEGEEDSPAVSEEAKPSMRPDSGRIRQVGFYPVDVATLEREVSAGLGALKARYGAHVSERDVVYAGFSRGAFLGASLAMKRPELFRRLVLIEGGHSPWKAEAASAFARSGGKRVLFACGQPSCVEDAEQAATSLRALKTEARVVHGVGEGHGYRKQVKEELRRSFDWVIDDDPMWERPQ